jgi:excinuclease UvrABC nuclease subunit
VKNQDSEARKEPFHHYKFAAALVQDGWRTPDSYSNDFEPLPPSPGVYLISLIKFIRNQSSTTPQVLYVGKSTNLIERLSNHEVVAEIRDQVPPYCLETGINYSIQRWFKNLDLTLIGAAEIELIKQYHPAFNLQHRVKMVLHG